MSNPDVDIRTRINNAFARCDLLDNYKVLVYVKNAGNYKKFMNECAEKFRKNNATISENEKNMLVARFKNGSQFLVLVADDSVVGEKCHMLLVDHEIREKQLMELSPHIEVYKDENNGVGILNPNPIYLDFDYMVFR